MNQDSQSVPKLTHSSVSSAQLVQLGIKHRNSNQLIFNHKLPGGSSIQKQSTFSEQNLLHNKQTSNEDHQLQLQNQFQDESGRRILSVNQQQSTSEDMSRMKLLLNKQTSNDDHQLQQQQQNQFQDESGRRIFSVNQQQSTSEDMSRFKLLLNKQPNKDNYQVQQQQNQFFDESGRKILPANQQQSTSEELSIIKQLHDKKTNNNDYQVQQQQNQFQDESGRKILPVNYQQPMSEELSKIKMSQTTDKPQANFLKIFPKKWKNYMQRQPKQYEISSTQDKLKAQNVSELSSLNNSEGSDSNHKEARKQMIYQNQITNYQNIENKSEQKFNNRIASQYNKTVQIPVLNNVSEQVQYVSKQYYNQNNIDLSTLTDIQSPNQGLRTYNDENFHAQSNAGIEKPLIQQQYERRPGNYITGEDTKVQSKQVYNNQQAQPKYIYKQQAQPKQIYKQQAQPKQIYKQQAQPKQIYKYQTQPKQIYNQQTVQMQEQPQQQIGESLMRQIIPSSKKDVGYNQNQTVRSPQKQRQPKLAKKQKLNARNKNVRQDNPMVDDTNYQKQIITPQYLHHTSKNQRVTQPQKEQQIKQVIPVTRMKKQYISGIQLKSEPIQQQFYDPYVHHEENFSSDQQSGMIYYRDELAPMAQGAVCCKKKRTETWSSQYYGQEDVSSQSTETTRSSMIRNQQQETTELNYQEQQLTCRYVHESRARSQSPNSRRNHQNMTTQQQISDPNQPPNGGRHCQNITTQQQMQQISDPNQPSTGGCYRKNITTQQQMKQSNPKDQQPWQKCCVHCPPSESGQYCKYADNKKPQQNRQVGQQYHDTSQKQHRRNTYPENKGRQKQTRDKAVQQKQRRRNRTKRNLIPRKEEEPTWSDLYGTTMETMETSVSSSTSCYQQQQQPKRFHRRSRNPHQKRTQRRVIKLKKEQSYPICTRKCLKSKQQSLSVECIHSEQEKQTEVKTKQKHQSNSKQTKVRTKQKCSSGQKQAEAQKTKQENSSVSKDNSTLDADAENAFSLHFDLNDNRKISLTSKELVVWEKIA